MSVVAVDTPGGFRFSGLNEVIRQATGADYLCKPFLERDTVALWFGDSASFKSFIALDLGLCIAHGLPFHGHPTHQGAVFYLCGEGLGGIGRRTLGWTIEHGIEHFGPFFVSQLPAQLADELSAQAVANAIQALSEEAGATPALVIVDTLSANLGDADESSNADMGRFIANLNSIIRAPLKTTVLVVHHVGHGDKTRERGAYALRGNTDARARIERAEGCMVTTLQCEKVKDGEHWPPISFEAREVSLDLLDSEGDEVTTLVLRPTDAPPATRERLATKQAECLDVLKQLYREHGDRLEEKGHPRDQARVKATDWSGRAIETGASNTRQRFHEQKSALINKGYVAMDGPYAVVRPDESVTS